MADADLPPPLRFLAGGGRASALILKRDWTGHALGPPGDWPDGLKVALSLVLNSPESMILAWGRDQLTFFFNDTYAPLLGPRVAWAMGEPFATVWADGWEQAKPIIDDAFAGKAERFVDVPWRLGTDRGAFETWFSFSYSRVLDTEGEVAGLFVVTNETTARVLADAAAREADDRLRLEVARQRLSLQQMPGFAAILTGPAHVFEYANDAYVAIPGGRALIGLSVREALPELAGQGFFELLDGVFATGEARRLSDMPVLLSGQTSPFYIDFVYEPIRDDGGAVAGIFVAGYEVTERVVVARRRDALLRIDERLRDVADTAELSFAASELLGQALGAVRVGYGVLDREARTITVERNWSAEGYRDVAGVHHFDDYGSYIAELLAGEAVANADVETDPRTADKTASFRALGIAAHLDVPVVEHGQAVATIFVHADAPRVWTDEEIALVRDVTERARGAIARRHAERELRDSEDRYRRIVEGAEDFAIVTLNEAGVITGWNTGAERLLGFADDEAIGRPGAVFFTPEDRERGIPDHEMRRAGSDGRAVDERWHLRKDGSRFWGSGLMMRLEGAGGGYLKIFRDRTAEHEAEAALRDLNADLERKVTERAMARGRTWQVSPEIMGVINADGYFEQSNPAWATILGWSPDDVARTPFFDFVHPDDLASTQGAWADATERHLPALRFENRYRTKMGGWRWLSWVAVPDDGKIYCSARDITDDKAREAALDAAQEALRQSQKLEAIGSLTGGVAHDFNNLLTPIVGALDMLQRRGLGGEREARLIAGAAQSADRAKTLVQRLLAFARRQPLQPVAVDVAGLVRNMGDLVRSTTGPQIRVTVEAADALPAARADPNQLEMALLNLAVNARDAMPDGGSLRISATEEDVAAGQADGLAAGTYIRLSVADTGTGMDAGTAARAVEPFFSTKGVGKGTGLGLSIVHGLASQLGGALTIDSRPGLGTNVSLWLPRSDAAPEATPTVTAAAIPAGRGTVLLVDDEDAVRATAAAMLADLGYDVIEAEAAEPALAIVRGDARLDLVVTDHLMPGMTGSDLARAIRTLRPGVPLLVISGYAESEGIEPDLPRLTKPFRHDELATALAALGGP